MFSNNYSKFKNGFTLLEILLALTLLGIVATALYGSYFTVNRARERANEGIESRRELGNTLDMIRRESASAIYRAGDKKLKLVVEDRDFFGKPSSTLEFTTIMPPSIEVRKESGLSLIRYKMSAQDAKLKDAPAILTREEYDFLLEKPQSLTYPQMERISAFLVECYDGSKWVKSWDTAINNRLPEMLRITVQVDENGAANDYSVLSPLRVKGL